MNRRTALQSLTALAASAFGVRRLAVAADRCFTPPSFVHEHAREELSPQEVECNKDRLALLPAARNLVKTMNDVERGHADCRGCRLCIDAAAILFHATIYESLLDSEILWTDEAHAAAEAEAERLRTRVTTHRLSFELLFRALVAVSDFEEALKRVLDRHAGCSCTLCGDVQSMHWQVSQYHDTAFFKRGE
jgi:ferredoxin